MLECVMLNVGFAYNFEMDWWPPKRGDSKMPVVPDCRPYLDHDLFCFILPVVWRRHLQYKTHCLGLDCSRHV